MNDDERHGFYLGFMVSTAWVLGPGIYLDAIGCPSWAIALWVVSGVLFAYSIGKV